MKKYLERITYNYSTDELIRICKWLNKNYNIYDPDEFRWNQLSYALSKTLEKDIEDLKSCHLSNTVVNDLIFSFYYCERVVKYHFIKSLMEKNNHIVAFEMSIGESRIDICRINGSSYAYEIKTEYDTFDRLESQMHDYTSTFDKVYVIVPKSRVKDVISRIPASCGVISYQERQGNTMTFAYAKRATKNQCDPYRCLNSLSSSDMSILLHMMNVDSSVRTRAEKLQALIEYSEKKSIWKYYRILLRTKYAPHWEFLTEHFEEILPIDVQSFFSANIDPSLLYQK